MIPDKKASAFHSPRIRAGVCFDQKYAVFRNPLLKYCPCEVAILIYNNKSCYNFIEINSFLKFAKK